MKDNTRQFKFLLAQQPAATGPVVENSGLMCKIIIPSCSL